MPLFRRPLTRAIPIIFALFVFYLLYRAVASGGAIPHQLPAFPKPNALSYQYAKPSFDWAGFEYKHPRTEAQKVALPKGKPLDLPPVQYSFKAGTPAAAGAAIQTKRRAAVRDAFKKSWDSYRKYAWKSDELTPLSGGKKNPFGGLGATLVDALDTLWIMDLKAEFYEAVQAVATIDFMSTSDTSLNLFETTIRYLGGMLSAYDLSGEEVLLRKAVDLGDMLYVAFDTPNHLPGFWFSFQDAKDGIQRAGTSDASAAPCSLSLEFTRLSQLTGDPKYYQAIDRVTRFLERTQNTTDLPGMWPRLIDFQNELVLGHDFTLGALADSLYEYFPKMFALLGGREPRYETLYRSSMEAAEKNLLFRPMTPDGADVLFAGDANVLSGSKTLLPEGQHLTCFVGGMFGLGGKLFGIERHVDLGERLARGCAWGYAQFPSGILPEIFGLMPCPSLDEACEWQAPGTAESSHLPRPFTHARDARYILRPEAIESVFLLYRMTGKKDLQDIAWDMFEAIRKATETKYAFAALENVDTDGTPKQVDSMESFWLAETLKYFYLVFSKPDFISLDDYVFNTEAHPLKRP